MNVNYTNSNLISSTTRNPLFLEIRYPFEYKQFFLFLFITLFEFCLQVEIIIEPSLTINNEIASLEIIKDVEISIVTTTTENIP